MSRLTYIDGLRGVAITLVFLRHYYMRSYSFGLPRFADVFSYGAVGVHLFLLLSGVCISYRYVGANARSFELGSSRDWLDFWKRRLQRILPGYYAILLFAFIAMRDLPTIKLQIIAHLFFMNNMHPETIFALSVPFWSLALEAQLYLLFPIFLKLYKKWGILGMLSIVFLAQLFYRSLFADMQSNTAGSWPFILPWGVLGRMFDFTLGMTIAIWLQRKDAETHPLRPAQQKQIAVAALFLLAGAYFSGARLDLIHPLTDLCWNLFFVCIFLLASSPKSLVQRVLEWRPLVFIGKISYSLYLTHEVFLRLFFDKGPQFFHKSMLVLLPVAGLTLLGGYLFYRLIEKPCMDYFARATKARANANTNTKKTVQ
jgi:peptidoglycan/LPS O-acetylase OafA/YrhL